MKTYSEMILLPTFEEKFVEPGRKAISSALKYLDDTVDNLTKRR